MIYLVLARRGGKVEVRIFNVEIILIPFSPSFFFFFPIFGKARLTYLAVTSQWHGRRRSVKKPRTKIRTINSVSLIVPSLFLLLVLLSQRRFSVPRDTINGYLHASTV